MAAMLILEMFAGRALKKERVFRDRTQILETLDDETLISRYRLSRDLIFELLAGLNLEHPTRRSHALAPQLQLLIALRYYAKGGFLSEIADIHGVSRASASRAITIVTDQIAQNFKSVITFPRERELIEVKSGFHSIANVPNVVGAIDGTLIPIIAPKVDEHVFVCRKGYHAINAQAIVDHKMRFIDCVVRWPGNAHDSHVLSNSTIYNKFEEGDFDGWLLGDSGYPCRPWLLTPVATPSNRPEERYNNAHARTRSVVERAFGICKSRFRCLHKSTGCILFEPSKCCRIIFVCFILHNMCINLPIMDEIDNDQEDEPNAANFQDANTGNAARQNLINLRFQ